jgi:hypothetical protein
MELQWKKMQKTWPNPLVLEGIDQNGRRCKKHGQTLSCWNKLIEMEEDAQNNGQTLSCWKGLIAMEEDAQKHGPAL